MTPSRRAAETANLEAEIDRLKRVAEQAYNHIDCLLLYATTYPGDSHPRSAVAFAKELARDLGINRAIRTEAQFKDGFCLPPYPLRKSQ